MRAKDVESSGHVGDSGKANYWLSFRRNHDRDGRDGILHFKR